MEQQNAFHVQKIPAVYNLLLNEKVPTSRKNKKATLLS